MNEDGSIDYRNHTVEELREACWNIDRRCYPKNLENLLRELKAKGGTDPTIERLPDSAGASLARKKKRSSGWVAIAALDRAAYCNTAICLALLAIFMLEFCCRGPHGGIQNSIAAAGLVKTRAVDGEWWRLLTGPLLHASVQHIYFNLAALFIFGALVEGLSSHVVLPLVVLLSAVGGSVASMVFLPHTTTVGISGAVMGVMGFFLAYQLTRKPRLPLQAFSFVGINIGINLVIGALGRSTIDNAAHIGGLLTGIVLGLMLTLPHRDSKKKPIQPPAAVRMLGSASVAVLVGGCGIAIFRLILPR